MRRLIVCSLLIPLLFIFGCRAKAKLKPLSQQQEKSSQLEQLGYTIQVGAFSRVENALRMTETLRNLGIEAYYFRHETGIYKVRFGEFSLRKTAVAEAQDLLSRQVIKEFYIVNPIFSNISSNSYLAGSALQASIVEKAMEYQGLPYCWGGTTPEEGFDCSGLAVAVYRLHGLILPRTSAEQYSQGIPLTRDQLEKGDLVFFSTQGGNRVSHVGIYIGSRRFIHAPALNKTIRIDALDNLYYRSRYIGARRYIY